MLKKVLDQWGGYLSTPASAGHLAEDEHSWFGPTGMIHLTKVANRGVTNHKFEDMFVCEPDKPHHGYKSWFVVSSCTEHVLM